MLMVKITFANSQVGTSVQILYIYIYNAGPVGAGMLYVCDLTYSTLINVAVLTDLYILFSSMLLSVIGSGRREEDCTVFGTGLYSVWYRIVQCLVQDCTVFGTGLYSVCTGLYNVVTGMYSVW